MLSPVRRPSTENIGTYGYEEEGEITPHEGGDCRGRAIGRPVRRCVLQETGSACSDGKSQAPSCGRIQPPGKDVYERRQDNEGNSSKEAG